MTAVCPACGQYVRKVRKCATPDCGHNERSHDIAKDGSRTVCFHITGPQGVRCTCRRFTEAPVPAPGEVTA